MKVTHDAETDMMYIEFEDRPGLDSFELCDGIVVDLEGEREPEGLRSCG